MRKNAILVGLLAGLGVCGSGYAGPLQPNATFTGGVAFSADGVRGDIGGILHVDTIAANILGSPNTQDVTVKAAYLYNVTFSGSSPATTQASLAGSTVTLNLLSGTDPTPNILQTYRTEVTSIVAPLVNGQARVTSLAASLIPGNVGDPTSDGLALVVVFSSSGLDPRQSVAIIDGGQAGSTLQTAAFGLGGPLDKTIPGFNAVLSLGINFSTQAANGHACGPVPQFSTVDIDGTRLSSCAGNADKGQIVNGALITVGGFNDSTNNPSDPFCQAGNPLCSVQDDELYGISAFLNQGDTQVKLTTANPSNDDSIFLGILQLTAVINQVCQVSCVPVPPPPGVPEPATLILLGAGFLGLIVGSRLLRKR